MSSNFMKLKAPVQLAATSMKGERFLNLIFVLKECDLIKYRLREKSKCPPKNLAFPVELIYIASPILLSVLDCHSFYCAVLK